MTRGSLAFIGLTLAAACTTYGSEDAAPVVAPVDGGTVDAAPIAAADSGLEDGAVALPFCKSEVAAGALVCDDFESSDALEPRWTFEKRAEGAGTRVDGVAGRGGIASFSLAGAPPACAYHWIQKTLDGSGYKRASLSFLLRPTRVEDESASVAYLGLGDGSDSSLVQHFLYVQRNASASYYQHSSTDNHHTQTGQIALGTWVRIEVRVDLTARTIEMYRDGNLTAQHQSIYALTDPKRIHFGVGFPCTNAGGAFDFDDILFKAER